MQADQRPVILGMNNPHGSDPRYALYPYPEYSAGGRLYAMFCEGYERRFGCDFPGKRRGYLEEFDRRNVLASAKWNAGEARRQGMALVRDLAGRRVVVLGRSAAKAMGLPVTPWFEKRGARSAGMEADGLPELTFWTIPHPSGMCREYNDPAVRARAGDLLHDLMQETPSRD